MVQRRSKSVSYTRAPTKTKKLGKRVARLETYSQANIGYIELANATPTILSYAGSIIPLNQIGKGDSTDTRDGNRVILTSVQLRAYFINGASTSHIARMLIVWDKVPNSTIFTMVDLLNDTISNPYISNTRTTSKQRFKILKDKTFVLPISANNNKYISYYKRLNKKVVYNDDTLDPMTGGLYMVLLSDAVTSHPTIEYNILVKFQK